MKDINYWNDFYSKGEITFEPSSFAVFCIEKIFNKQKVSNIIELGSGNGRDAFYIATHKNNVFALEQSKEAVKIEQKHLDILNKENTNLKLINDDFINFDFKSVAKEIDIFYSRFTIHSIPEIAETIVLNNVFNTLSSGGIFVIEARTTKDPLLLKGKKVGFNEFVTDHYRRFIDTDTFIKKAFSIGYKLQFFTEEDNLSIYKGDNPVLMRIVLVKP